jgi:hypothetical protein
MTRMRLLLAGAMIVAIGCIPSLYPVYTPNDVIFEPALIGGWANEDASQIWQFSKHSDLEYGLLLIDKEGREGHFVGHLTKIDGQMYLDMFPDKLNVGANDYYKAHFVPSHTFVRVQQVEPTLELLFPNFKWLDELLKKQPDALRHERAEGRFVITAPTEELRTFLQRHQHDTDAFSKPVVLTRVSVDFQHNK